MFSICHVISEKSKAGNDIQGLLKCRQESIHREHTVYKRIKTLLCLILFPFTKSYFQFVWAIVSIYEDTTVIERKCKIIRIQSIHTSKSKIRKAKYQALSTSTR